MKRIFFFLLLLPVISDAQSYSFSQFYSTPLALNPALTGSAQTEFRLSGNFRSQWIYGGNPYLTGSVGLESKILTNSVPDYHSWGIGASVLTDQSNAGGLSYSSYAIGSAYHVALDPEGIQTLGVGIQGSFNQRTFNLNRLRFETQFGSGGFNAAIPIGESFQNLAKSYMDIHVGVLYQYSSERMQISLGGAMFNILEPDVYSMANIYRLPKRYVIHVGFASSVSENTSIIGSLTGMSVNGLANITAGLAFQKRLERMSFTGGCWYRVGDAVIPYFGIGMDGLTLGFSFDNTISDLKTIAQTRNAVEVGLMYTPMKAYKELKRAIPWY